ncbi:hypothetical protein LINPERHAP1_LOCUS8524 [Linum perenne]
MVRHCSLLKSFATRTGRCLSPIFTGRAIG